MVAVYKWDAEDYHVSSSIQQQWARELIAKLALKGTERVLDIGCGDGKSTAEIAGHVPGGSVLGIDTSNEMISFATANFSNQKFKNLSFVMMDATKLNFKSEFDVVFSNSALHWVIDHLPILKGIKKSLKPSGKVLLQMGGKGNASQIFEVLVTIMQTEKWSRYFTDFQFPWGFYGPEEYKNWLELAGLKAKRVELVPKDMINKNKDSLLAWFRTTWLPYTQRAPEELREELLKEIVDKYIEKYHPDRQDSIHIQMVRLEVEAVIKTG